MATPFQFREATATANAILAADKKSKPQWQKLPIESLPPDLAQLAHDACVSECVARQHMLAFKAAMDDKLVAPPGRKFIFAVERGVTDPNMVGDMLFANVAGSTSNTSVVSFDQLVAKYK